MSTQPPMELILKFVDAFEQVFDRDWAYTKEMLGIHTPPARQMTEEERQELQRKGLPITEDESTFLRLDAEEEIDMEEEIDNWGNRRYLLHAYRELKKALT